MKRTDEETRKHNLLKLATEMKITREMCASMAMFGREFKTATADQVRQALVDAFIMVSHRKRVAAEKATRGRAHLAFNQEELDTIARISKTAGIEPNKSKR